MPGATSGMAIGSTPAWSPWCNAPWARTQPVPLSGWVCATLEAVQVNVEDYFVSKMKQYCAAQVITLRVGKVKLTEQQARRRMQCVSGKKGQKSGIFEIVRPIQFKVGEEFGYDGEIPKFMLPHVADDDTDADSDESAALAESDVDAGGSVGDAPAVGLSE